MAFDKFIKEELDLSPLLDVSPTDRRKMRVLEQDFNIVREVPLELLVADLSTPMLYLFGQLRRAQNQTTALLWAISILKMYYDQGE